MNTNSPVLVPVTLERSSTLTKKEKVHSPNLRNVRSVGFPISKFRDLSISASIFTTYAFTANGTFSERRNQERNQFQFENENEGNTSSFVYVLSVM